MMFTVFFMFSLVMMATGIPPPGEEKFANDLGEKEILREVLARKQTSGELCRYANYLYGLLETLKSQCYLGSSHDGFEKQKRMHSFGRFYSHLSYGKAKGNQQGNSMQSFLNGFH